MRTTIRGAGAQLLLLITFLSVWACRPRPEQCDNKRDDDEDGLIDCADPGCDVNPVCIEDCSDGVDNDENSLVDCSDPDCVSDPGCRPGSELCQNGADDNQNGLVDCEDSLCAIDSLCQTGGEVCNNAQDDNQNGLVDCKDPGCAQSIVCQIAPENCQNSLDDDEDTFVDCDDPNCAQHPSCVINAETLLVPGAGLTLQDVSEDGTLIAYTDSQGSLFTIPSIGGASLFIAANIDAARFKGKFLLLFQGLSVDGESAAAMLTLLRGETQPTPTGARVNIDTVRASADGEHLFFEQDQALDPSIQDFFLDGVSLGSAIKVRGRFSAANNFLVVSSDIADPNNPGGELGQVRSFSLLGGAPIPLLASGAAGRFDISKDGQSVIIAANETGDVADLVRVPIAGGAGLLLVPQGSDNAFSVLDDGARLAFLQPNDPNQPTTFGLGVIGLDGLGRALLVASGVADITATAQDTIVYTTSAGQARMIGTDGSADTTLGASILDEGFSPGEQFYTFRDQVVGEAGRLQVVNVGTRGLSTLGASVTKSSFIDEGRVVFLDGPLLQIGDLATAGAQTLSGLASGFDEVPDGVGIETSSNIVFTIPSGANAGLVILPL